MSATAVKVPVFGSIAAAAKAYAATIRQSLVAGALGAVLTTLFLMLSATAPVFGLIWTVMIVVVWAFVYTALIAMMVGGTSNISQRATQEGGRVLAAMGVVCFFMLVVFVPAVICSAVAVAIAITGMLPRGATPPNQEQVLAAVEQLGQTNPGFFVVLALVNIFIWMSLTSWLYCAAPATYEAKRILTFETWKWTRGNMLRILAARLLLLGPVYLATQAISYGLNVAAGLSPTDAEISLAAIHSGPAKVALFGVIASFIQFALYCPLEAALSSYIFKLLRPQSAFGRPPTT